MNWYNGNLTETDLLDNYICMSNLGENLSTVNGKPVSWEYAYYAEDGSRPAHRIASREDCNIIFLHFQPMSTLALPMDDGFAGRADARNHPTLKKLEG